MEGKTFLLSIIAGLLGVFLGGTTLLWATVALLAIILILFAISRFSFDFMFLTGIYVGIPLAVLWIAHIATWFFKYHVH